MICVLQFLFALLMGIQEAITAHTLSASAVWSALISAFLAVVKARAPEVVTGLKMLDKPQKDGQ